MALLRDRRIEARGDPCRNNDPREVLSSMWSNEAYYVDYEHGDLQAEDANHRVKNI